MAGRKTKYISAYCDQAEKLCKLGATDTELAEFFEVAESTLHKWKLDHPEFSESIKAGKIIADANVSAKLYQRAIGYSYDEVHYEKINVDVDQAEETDNEDMKMEVYRKKLIVKEVAPDTTAQIFWLKNRQKKKWRDKIETGITDGDGNDVNPVVIQIPHNGRTKDIKAATRLPNKGSK